jgi:RimJ/RimL family protein N-acetyltransferase
MRWILEDRALTSKEATALIDTRFIPRDDVFGLHVIARSPVDEAIGLGSYRSCTLLDAPDVEFGWAITEPHRGRGYATALGGALIRHAFDTWHLDRIIAGCHPHNAPSEHILRDKLGMRFEREVEPRPQFRRRVYSLQRP